MTSPFPQPAACPGSSFAQTAWGIHVNAITSSYPFPAARGSSYTWAMQFAFLATVFARAVFFSQHLAYAYTNGSKPGLGALARAGGGTLSFRQAAWQTPCLCGTCIPGELAAHPGLGAVPSEHTDTEHTWPGRRARASNRFADSRDGSRLGRLRCLGCLYTALQRYASPPQTLE